MPEDTHRLTTTSILSRFKDLELRVAELTGELAKAKAPPAQRSGNLRRAWTFVVTIWAVLLTGWVWGVQSYADASAAENARLSRRLTGEIAKAQVSAEETWKYAFEGQPYLGKCIDEDRARLAKLERWANGGSYGDP